MKDSLDLIKALEIHSDTDSIHVLERIGTNNVNDKIREATAIALVNKNTVDSLKVILLKKGKGINDLSPQVVDTTIKHLNKLKDKTQVNKLLDDAIDSETCDKIKERALLVKQMLSI